MGLLDRFRAPKTEELAKAVADELAAKGLGSTPYAGSGGTVLPSYGPGSETNAAQATGQGGAGLLQTPGMSAVPLPRETGHFGAQLGPAAPFLPAMLDAPEDTGRALPRLWEYPVAWNLNLTDRATPWTILRSLAEQCDVVARCIEIRTAELVSLEWDVTVSDHAVTEIMSRDNCSHAKAYQTARDENAEEIDRLKAFWENPYPSDRPWTEWLTELAWQHFVYDAIAIYPRLNLGGKVIGFEIIDAATIKPLLDNRGARPEPPAPAFQQILWGFPRGEYQASPNVDGEFYAGDTPNGEYAKDQLAYFVRNRRTWSPYGVSAVERSIPAATLYLERQGWLKSEYADGALPRTFLETDSEEMDPVKLAQLERIMNDQLGGQTGERHRLKLLPRGFKPSPMPSIDERYKADYDEFVIKQIASKFGVQPSQLGILPSSGLGGNIMDGYQDQAETMSKRPTEQFMVGVINSLMRRFLGASRAVTFTLTDPGTASQAVEQAKALKVQTDSGQATLNDARTELGLPLYDMPEADEPFVLAAGGPVFLRGLLGVDASGETTGQLSEEEAQAEAAIEDGSSPEPKPALEEPKVEESSPEQAAEMKAFRAFVTKRAKTGKWRDFAFEHLDPEDATELNADAELTVTKAEGYTPPKAVQAEAKRALEWIAEGHAGAGFTDVGRKRAADLAAGRAVSRETIGRISNYLGRHQGDSQGKGWSPDQDGYPSPGRVAWAAWGGDPAIAWTRGILEGEKGATAELPKAPAGRDRLTRSQALRY